MKVIINTLVFFALLTQSSLIYSANHINIIFLPDSYDCHHTGVEGAITKNSRLGILAVVGCDSDRPTYGDSNDKVTNEFSRILIPWTYSAGAWDDGYFLKVLAGLENHKFESNIGSRAEVTFADISANVGYQWFWNSGFNVSASLGVAFLFQNSVDKNIHTNESSDVVDFLDKNTKTNQHTAFGIILGWAF